MRRLKLKALKEDSKWFESKSINLQYISDFITGVLNEIRPCKSLIDHKIKVCVVDSEYSYYDFTDTLFIARKNAELKGSKQKIRIIEDIFHEVWHYIQYKIDRVSINKFAINHESISYNSYFRNKTEVQARSFSRLAKECIETLSKARKIKRHLQKLP